MRQIDEIIVHCAATQPDWMEGSTAWAKRMEIDRWHKERGWKGFGYHGLIDRDGTFATGRPYAEQGAHVSGHNSDTLGICLVGGHGGNENDQFSDHFTEAQEKALIEWIEARKAEFPSITKVSGHNEYAAKACPCFRVKDWYPAARSRWLRGDMEPEAPTPPESTGGGLAALFEAILRALGVKV